ncbi:MAG TPA: DUF4157 domain-containing protein [Longimicrobiaceae bacterium]
MQTRLAEERETQARRPGAREAPAPEGAGPAASMLRLQRTVGNAAVQRLLASRSGGSGAFEAPERVEAEIGAARGGGRGLGAGVRRSMEQAFGADFGGVRVHDDARADRLSRDLSARAFTTGRDIFFRAGEYRPGTPSGDTLLAHELTHVVQQDGGVRAKLEVGAADDESEREADRAADAVVRTLRAPAPSAAVPAADVQRCGCTGCACGGATAREEEEEPVVRRSPVPVLGRAPGARVARQAALARPPVRPPPPARAPSRPPLRVIEGGGGRAPQAGTGAPGRASAPDAPAREPLWIPDAYDNSWDAMSQRAGIAARRDADLFNAEQTTATLARGGAPPNFETEREQLGMWEWGTARYRERTFHVLDAIEHEVGRAERPEDLDRILETYIPDWRTGLRHGAPLLLPRFRIPEGLDPLGEQRLAVYRAAVRRRAVDRPALARARAVPLEESEETRRRRCTITPLRGAGLGNDPLASLFCEVATGSPFEYRVTSPTMGSAVFDALLGNTVYECKCGYGSLLRGVDQSRFWARMRADRLDEQVQRHLRIATDCGLRYRYVVSNREFADFLRQRWFGVDIVHRPWEPCD